MFHHGNRENLVYWLEFKNDDKFQTNMFGGFGGGSTFKFQIYIRKEDGKWISGSPQISHENTIIEAISIAREKRDQLIKGAEFIASMPTNDDDEAYVNLQENLSKALGSFADSAWVHKYYHIMFPGKFEDFHIPEYHSQYQQVGNAVPPLLTEGIAYKVLDNLERVPQFKNSRKIAITIL